MPRLTIDAIPPLSQALPVPIDRCRELLGDMADSLTDEDLDEVREHAALMARLLIGIYLHRARET
jgi:hypothetical protein